MRTPKMQYACAIQFERIDIPRAGQSQMSNRVAFVEINCGGNEKHYDLLAARPAQRPCPYYRRQKVLGEAGAFCGGTIPLKCEKL